MGWTCGKNGRGTIDEGSGAHGVEGRRRRPSLRRDDCVKRNLEGVEGEWSMRARDRGEWSMRARDKGEWRMRARDTVRLFVFDQWLRSCSNMAQDAGVKQDSWIAHGCIAHHGTIGL